MSTETKLGRPFGPITETIRKTCDKKNGAAMAEIREAIDRDSQHCASMVNHCVQRGFIFKAGVRTHLRYFLNPADRDAFALVAEKLHADECKAAKIAKQQRRREWYAARVAAMPKKEKVVKVKLEEQKKPKKAKLLLQRAAKPQEVPAQIIWPEHVQVQRIPTPKDTRFTFEPPPGWVGEITCDWMNYRVQQASRTGARMCPECLIATDFHEYRLFNPLCKFCGARIVQVLGTLPVSAAEIKRRRLAMLDEWERFGHNRAEIRELAKGALALPTQATATADPLKKRRKKSSGAQALTGG